MRLTFHDEALGELTYDDRLDWWEGTFGPASVPLYLSDPGSAEIRELPQDEAALQTYRAALLRLRRDEPALRVRVAEALTQDADDWRDPDCFPEPVTGARFLERIALESVGIDADGRASVFYADGDLFGGHVIIASVDRDGHLTDADIAG